MTTAKIVVPASIALAAAVGAAILTGADHRPTVERIDFSRTARATTPTYDARLTPLSDARVREFRIPIENTTLRIADGVTYHGWTFGGTVPGPVIHVRQGDSVRITVVNESPMPHSIDFHAARIAPNLAYRMILPHDSVRFAFVARDAAAFLVHCGTAPVLLHLMQGMYLPMIVDPKGGWGTTADKEFVIVQSEFYADLGASGHAARPDYSEAQQKQPSYVVFNGRAFQYKSHPLAVNLGDRVRFFVVNAGPNMASDFHVVGAVFDRVYPDGDPGHALHDVQTYAVPAGGGAVFETRFDRNASAAGTYAFVTHSFADAEKGAMGAIQVGTSRQVATLAH